MDKLETIVHETLKIAEKAMQKEGFANPKVVVFYRDETNDLGTYMIDLSPQSYFDKREDIMTQVGTFLATKKDDGVRAFDTVVHYGEAKLTIDKLQKEVIMATAMNAKGESVTRFKEVQRFLNLDHPERPMFQLADLEIQGLKKKSSLLTNLLIAFNTK